MVIYAGNYTKEMYLINLRRFYRTKLQEKLSGDEREKYEEKLAFEQQIDYNESHSKLLAHLVTAYDVKFPVWEEHEGLLVPYGDLESRLVVDFGEILVDELECPEELFKAEFTDRIYIFEMNSCTREEPLIFHVISYKKIDDLFYEEGKEIVKPLFKMDEEGNPTEFERYFVSK